MSRMTATFSESSQPYGGGLKIGSELQALVERKLPGDDEAQDRLKHDSLEVLGLCVPAGVATPQRSTVLVVGRVQSGKTLSFTAVTAAAHDNGHRLVIVLAGTANNVAEQTRVRLQQDLHIDGHGWDRPWWLEHNPSPGDSATLKREFAAWEQSGSNPGSRKTVVLTVLKQQDRLDSLTEMLRRAGSSLGSVLVIDDEADQASMNTAQRRPTASRIHQAIADLRAVLPRHTFLQYTATPQAPLLIRLIDELSPDKAFALRPGGDYVGGEQFFGDADHAGLSRPIPERDLVEEDDFGALPPASLHEAMRIFFLSVAALHAKNHTRTQRSMMVHPSRLQAMHELFHNWVEAARERWAKLLEDEAESPQVLEDFRHAYADLASTAEDLPSFNELVPHLGNAMRRTRVQLINSKEKAPPVLPWSRHSGWILVGGQSLDRGFTVEGLTVTYMPRGSGVGNADTIQQRGRFFGYKRSYLGHCRLYLEGELLENYRRYVAHERSIHSLIAEHRGSNENLRERARRIELTPDLNPTRSSVVDPGVRREAHRNPWFQQRALLVNEQASRNNGAVVDRFLAELEAAVVPDRFGGDVPDAERHRVAAGLPLQRVQTLLETMSLSGREDAALWENVLYAVRQEAMGNPKATASVVLMHPEQRNARKVVPKRGELRVEQAFGRGSATGVSAAERRDDRSCFTPEDAVTLQLHRFDLYDGNVRAMKKAGEEPLAEQVPLLAVRLADRMLTGFVILDPDEADNGR